MFQMDTETQHDSVLISTGKTILAGILDVPPHATAVVILANGLGQLKHPAAEAFAARLHEAGLASVTTDLLTPDELQFDSRTGHFTNDADFQSERILDVVDWIRENPSTHDLPIAAAGSGAAARGILRAAARNSHDFEALIVDGVIRPIDVPSGLTAPTMLLVEDDAVEIRRAQNVMQTFAGPTQIRVISSADAARSISPFFSDAAGHLTSKWVLESMCAPV
jgi:putative phosphoribosyl transferase